MEKRRAHYNLATVIAVVMDRRAAAFTKSAIDGGRAMGLTVSEMIDVICALESGHLYKSMTTYKDSTVWQDVY